MLNFNLVTSVDQVAPPSGEGGHVHIVGKAKEGALLLHRVVKQNETAVSVIDIYDVRQHTLTTLYRHSSELMVSSCSTNQSRTFLALTTLTRLDEFGEPTEDPEEQLRYESHIITLTGDPSWVSFTLRSTEYQCLQFFGEERTTFFGEEKIVAYFLFFLDQETIDMYQVQRKRSSDRVVTEEVKTQPELRSLFYKQLTWFEWDVENDLLYALTPQAQGKDENTQYLLRCIRFSGSRRPERPESVMEIVLQMSLAHRPLPPPPPPTATGPCVRPLLASQRHPYLHVVKLRSNIVALCQQHVIQTSQSPAQACNIGVTIYVFPDLFKLDFTVPLRGLTASQAQRTRLFFGHIADMLLVYVPRQYLRLIDCSSEHEPCDSLTLGPDLVPDLDNAFVVGDDYRWPFPSEDPADPLRDRPLVIESFGSCPDFVDEVHLMDVPDNSAHAFLDYSTGSIYEFHLSREAILHAFNGIVSGSDGSDRGGELTSDQACHMLVQLLHLTVVHLQDLELADNIMRAVCRRSTNFLGLELPKEYLLAVSYQTLKTASDVDPHLMHTLPVSTLVPFASGHQDHHHLIGDHRAHPDRISFAQYSPINGSYYAPGPHMKYPRSKTRNTLCELGYAAMNRAVTNTSRNRLSNTHRNSLSGSNRGKGNMPNDAGIRTFFQFLGLGDNERVVRDFSVDDDLRSLDTGGNRRFMTHLLDHLSTTYPKENRRKCGQLCDTFSDIREAKSMEVYTLFASNLELNRVSHNLDTHVLLDVYMALYCALEELAFPIPHNLRSRLAELGLSCLPRSVYLQYVERGVFAVHESLVKRVSANMGVTEADTNFMHHLVRRLDREDCAVEILEDHVRGGRLIAEYISSTDPEFERKLLVEPPTDNMFENDAAAQLYFGGNDGDDGLDGDGNGDGASRFDGDLETPRGISHSERSEFAPAHAFISLFEAKGNAASDAEQPRQSAFVDYVLSHVSEVAPGPHNAPLDQSGGTGSQGAYRVEGSPMRPVLQRHHNLLSSEIDFEPVSPSKALAGNDTDPSPSPGGHHPAHPVSASIQLPGSLQLRMSAPGSSSPTTSRRARVSGEDPESSGSEYNSSPRDQY